MLFAHARADEHVQLDNLTLVQHCTRARLCSWAYKFVVSAHTEATTATTACNRRTHKFPCTQTFQSDLHKPLQLIIVIVPVRGIRENYPQSDQTGDSFSYTFHSMVFHQDQRARSIQLPPLQCSACKSCQFVQRCDESFSKRRDNRKAPRSTFSNSKKVISANWSS